MSKIKLMFYVVMCFWYFYFILLIFKVLLIAYLIDFYNFLLDCTSSLESMKIEEA